MEVISKHIAIGHNTTSARSSLINIIQCNRSADTAKPTSENHENSTGTANNHSVYTSNDNIEHGNTCRFVTPNVFNLSRNSVLNHTSNIEDFNEDSISSKIRSRELFPYFRGNNYISPVNKISIVSNEHSKKMTHESQYPPKPVEVLNIDYCWLKANYDVKNGTGVECSSDNVHKLLLEESCNMKYGHADVAEVRL